MNHGQDSGEDGGFTVVHHHHHHHHPHDHPHAGGGEVPPSPAETLSPEAAAAVLKQVEFYFSDANLPTDEFLLKQVKKSSQGWVNLHVIAKFKRMKALTSSVPAIAAALHSSELLVISKDGQAVRRQKPLPDIDPDSVAECTVVAENLPRENISIDALTTLFSKCGVVRVVRICHPGEVKSIAQADIEGKRRAHPGTNNQIVSNQMHALVEYSTPEEAAAACKELTDDGNWRAGLKVRPLVRGKSKWGHHQDGHGHHEDGHAHHQHGHGHHQHASPVGTPPKHGFDLSKGIPIPRSKTPSSAVAPELGTSPIENSVAAAIAMARKATQVASHNAEVVKSRRRSLEIRREEKLKRNSMEDNQRAQRHSIDMHFLPPRPTQPVRKSSLSDGAGLSDLFAAAAPSAAAAASAALGGEAIRAHIKHIHSELGTDGASSGTETSSGGEDAEIAKGKKGRRRKEYAKWASATASGHAATHHGVRQPLMPDGSKGFSMGRGKPLAPPT